MRKRTIGIMVAVLVLLMVGMLWAFRGRRDLQVERVKAMRGDGPPTPALRQEMEKLSPEQRQQVRRAWGEQQERRMDKAIDDYFKLPPDKRVAELDRRIQEMEKRRKDWEQRIAQAPRGSNASGQGPTAGGGQGSAAGAQRGGRGGSRNPTTRSERANQRLDNSSPAQRAQRQAYFIAVQQRRLQLGLPTNTGHGPRGR